MPPLTVSFRCDRMPGAGGPPGQLLQAQPPGVRDGGDRQRAGAGLTAWRQRPAPVRRRARGSGPGCPHQRRVPPSTPAPGGGPPARPLPSSMVIRAYAKSSAEAATFARTEQRT
jgi:hypothetical protein